MTDLDQRQSSDDFAGNNENYYDTDIEDP